MSDRELLDLAAKAAGYRIKFGASGDLYIQAGMNTRAWNPLTDDGDALRLSFELRLNMEFLQGFKQVHAYHQADPNQLFGLVGYGSGADKEPTLENVRLAIVKAAATIGRAMS